MFNIIIRSSRKVRIQKLRQFFDCYSLCDLEFWSSGPEMFKFNDCERQEIAILFERVVEEFYSYVRKQLDRVVFGEIEHYNRRCCKNIPNVTVKKIKKRRDAWTAEYIFRNLPWHQEYGGPLWADAAAFLLKHPTTTHEKMSWIDKVMDLQHNNGQIFSGKNSPLEVMEDDECIDYSSTESYYYNSPLDIRARGNMPTWRGLWSAKNSRTIGKYVGRVKHRYKTLKSC